MIVDVRPRIASLLVPIRLGLLVVVALVLGHTAIYLAQFGAGAGLATAMTSSGHDGYWPSFVLAAAVSAGILAIAARSALSTVSRHAPGNRQVANDPRSAAAPRYLPEVARLWAVLLPLTGVAFLLQENVEHLLSHLPLPGIGALIGAEHPMAVPLLAMVTLALSLLGGLVRWRVAVLRRRAAQRTPTWHRTVGASQPAVGQWIEAALAAHRWILVRLDAGRAPPLLA